VFSFIIIDVIVTTKMSNLSVKSTKANDANIIGFSGYIINDSIKISADVAGKTHNYLPM